METLRSLVAPKINNGFGAVWVFTRSNGVWSQQGSKLLPSDASSPPYFGFGPFQGYSTARSANGNSMIEGGPWNNNHIGAAWVFATPQLSTSLQHTGTFHRGQTGVTYSITVTNVGDREIRQSPE